MSVPVLNLIDEVMITSLMLAVMYRCVLTLLLVSRLMFSKGSLN